MSKKYKIMPTLATVVLLVAGIVLFAGCEKVKTNSTITCQNEKEKQIKNNNITNALLNVEYYDLYAKIMIGTHLFNNCNYNNPCGPCPGICFRSGIIFSNDITTYNAEEEGIIKINGIVNNKLHVTFLSPGFTEGNQTGFNDDYQLTQQEAAVLGFYDSIIVLPAGIYNVDYSNSLYGETELPMVFIIDSNDV